MKNRVEKLLDVEVISSITDKSAIEYLMTYGWMLLVVGIVGGAIYGTVQENGDAMPENFSYSAQKVELESTVGEVCRSTYNDTYEPHRYEFECCSLNPSGTHRYCVDASVKYNESGPNKVTVN